MKKRSRLLRRDDFTRLLGEPRLWAGRSMVAFAMRRPEGGVRIGVTATRRLSGPVVRNRARRRLREAARLALLSEDWKESDGGKGYDIVLVAREGAVTLPWRVVRAEMDAVARRLAGR